ncbi:hypothetical protein A2U01_0084043, partial [Trifolium medium]|nr:hypothetical protein [Trifolium medium]
MNARLGRYECSLSGEPVLRVLAERVECTLSE